MKQKTYHFALVLMLGALCACSEKENGLQSVTDVQVTFDVSQVDTRAGYKGELDLTTLKGTADFGVYAYYTGAKDNAPYAWVNYAADKGGALVPNFMYNQKVTWNSTTNLWEYTPVKYWPNGTGEATDEWGTGTVREPVSFFAYAPYAELDDVDTNEPNDPTSETYSGIIAIRGSQLPEKSGSYAPTVDYKIASGRNVDLLWATPQLDWLKPSVTTRVPFTFHHGLAAIKVMVQRVYDDYLPGDLDHHPNNATDTKLFIGSLSLAGDFYTKGTMRLDDGSWTTDDADRAAMTISCEEGNINEILSGSMIAGHGTTSSDVELIQDRELDKWNTTWDANADGTFTVNTGGTGTYFSGVIEEPRSLASNPSYFYVIPSGNNNVVLTPTIKYSFVTQDDALQLDYMEDTYATHRYSRITHTVTSAPINLGKLEGGKRYMLLCLIGVEHVSFELVSVEDWDFPIRFITDMSDIDKTSMPKEKVLNEE